jgi:hypothetical protein
MAMMSAQDTVFGQASSRTNFTPSMMSNLLIPKLALDAVSLVIPFAESESSSMDASHPCSKQETRNGVVSPPEITMKTTIDSDH